MLSVNGYGVANYYNIVRPMGLKADWIELGKKKLKRILEYFNLEVLFYVFILHFLSAYVFY
jgi:hypothetical protein